MSKKESLLSFYPDDLKKDFSLEKAASITLWVLAATWRDELASSRNIHKIYLYMLGNIMLYFYPNVARAYNLVLTLRVTSSSRAKDFFALKLVTNPLRSQMTQTRLSGVMVMAIQRKFCLWTACQNLKPIIAREIHIVSIKGLSRHRDRAGMPVLF